MMSIMTLPNVTHMIQMLSDPSTWYKHDTATCDIHDTGAVWCLLPDTNMIQAMWHTWYRWCLTLSIWYKHDTSYVTHMIQMLCDPLLPDTIMTLPHVTHMIQMVSDPSYLIQTWHCQMWHIWYRHSATPFYLIQTWYKLYVTHMIQMLCDPFLPDTIMTLPHMTHMIQMLCDPFYLIQSWHCHMWHTWYRWCLTTSTWYNHDTATCDTHATDLDPS